MKRLLFLLLVLIMAASLFAAGQRDSGQREVRVMLANHPYGDLLRDRIPEFERQTGIRVIWEQLQETQLTTRMTQEFASGAHSVDVFMTRPLNETLLFMRNNWLAPLDGFDFSDYGDSLVNIGRAGGTGSAHVVPLIVEWQVLYYRRDLLRAAGLQVPTTFEELENAARILNTGDVAGFGSRGSGFAGVTQLSSYIYNFGGRFMENGRSAFNSPQAIEALRFYGRINGLYGPRGIEGMSWDQLMPVFQAGRLAMWTDASVFLGQLIDPALTQVPAENIGVSRLPRGPVRDQPFIVVPWGLSMTRGVRDRDAAMQFLAWASSFEMQREGMLRNITMARTSVWNDPSIVAQVHPGLVETMIHASQYGYDLDRPFITSVVRAREYIGELITMSVTTNGTAPGLQALADQRVRDVDALLQADGELGTAR